MSIYFNVGKTRTLEEVRNDLSAKKVDNSNSKTNSTSKTSDAQEIATNQSSSELKEELEKLEIEKKLTLEKMERIEEQMQELAQEAQDNILEAAKKQEKAIEDHEDDAKKALEQEIQKYIEANKDGKEGMTKSQLSSNIANAMPDPQMGAVMAKLVEANEQIAQIDSLLGSLNMLISDVRLLEVDISSKTAQYESAVKKEAAKSCDPIGFTVDGTNGSTRYDFIVDDGSFDTTSDFLGSQGQWAEMQALDTSNDGIVSASELNDNNIKAVKTNPDGSREIVNLADEFGSDFSIDLSSYKQGGSHSSINTLSDTDNDGVQDQRLLGTFNVNINNQSIKGYNTLDDVDYLEEQYGVSADETTVEYSADVEPHVNFFEEFSEKSAQLKEDLSTAYESYGISEDLIETIDKQAQTQGQSKANFFMQELDKEMKTKAQEEEKKLEEAKKAREAQEAEKENKAKKIDDEDEVEEIDEDEDNEDNEDDDEIAKTRNTSFKAQDVTAMQEINKMSSYLNKIEKALENGNQAAVSALHGITETDISNIADKQKSYTDENNVIHSATGVENVKERLIEKLQDLKNEYPEGYQFDPDIDW